MKAKVGEELVKTDWKMGQILIEIKSWSCRNKWWRNRWKNGEKIDEKIGEKEGEEKGVKISEKPGEK